MGYSTERKQTALRKLLPPYNRTLADLAGEENVSTAAIYQWRKATRAVGRLLPENNTEPEGWSTLDEFSAVLEAAALAETKLAEYCRRRGLCIPRSSGPGGRLGRGPMTSQMVGIPPFITRLKSKAQQAVMDALCLGVKRQCTIFERSLL